MKESWFTGVESDKVKEIRGDFASSLVIRNRLKVILEDRINLSQKNSLSKSDYANPNWAFLQADRVGYERALQEVISLITE